MSEVRFALLALTLAGCAAAPPLAAPQPPVQPHTISAKPRRLGPSDQDGEGSALKLRFRPKPASQEQTLAISHGPVQELWVVGLNGRPLGHLRRSDRATTTYLPVAPDDVESGRNTLTLEGDPAEKIVDITGVELLPSAFADVVALGSVSVGVTDRATGSLLPARITIADANGRLAEPFYVTGSPSAVRQGIVYTVEQSTFKLPIGTYTLYATRGSEWGMDTQALEVRAGEVSEHVLEIAREVDTTGFIAADTHLHTLTFSGHGNATLRERVISLAGEGIEFAVATDHNHNTDYGPEQRKLELEPFYTVVTGNEVTTKVGHFNGFPLRPGDEIPDHTLTDWGKIVEAIRGKGAKVVVLNHPRWPHVERSPFADYDLNQVSGDAGTDLKATFDAMELVNTHVHAEEPLVLFADWFALLNRGERITAVGTSDSHTIEAPPGQGRTYIRNLAEDPSKIDPEHIYDALLAGHANISLGIFTDVRVAKDRRPGDIVTLNGKEVSGNLRVAAPTWIRPRRAMVFLNGRRVAERELAPTPNVPFDETLVFRIKRPAHDAHLVCVVVGDPVAGPAWQTLDAYTLGATNPVFLDVDNKAGYSSPRESARRLLPKYRNNLARLRRDLPRLDRTIAAQLLSLVRGDVDELVGELPAEDLAVPVPHTHTRDANEEYRDRWPQ